MNTLAVLHKTPIFQALSESDLTDVARNAIPHNFEKGNELFSMGDDAKGFFVILSGWIKLYRISREGIETIIHVFGPGETFAEAAVFNERHIYPVSAQAVDDGTMLEIPRLFFYRKIEENSRFALHMLAAIASRQHYLVQQLEQVSSRSAPQRVGAFLLRFCKKLEERKDGSHILDLPYDKSIIAKRLNIKPETFSRCFQQLRPYGVEVQGRRVNITTPRKLAEFCDFDGRDKPC
ncbi:MAG: Crp/Fnr family transcriptional regulator [Rhodospirillales bacterium]|nr:Crp/Fnr family transcriptional regulator [Alphaproteobacteria bacterium]MCB9986811.1 Crp/Fnr family transcriptional regulator [Rhodospirillales bacterium]USO08424.1 MAG: Crp/Fnr family transcriptional regulator [Rhodospirillales bacterium]